jgi:gamma-glutamylcyclotransferase
MARMREFIHYFAYGSNMSSRRLVARVPDARSLGTGVLRGHELRFHKRSRDGSGKCDAHQVDRDDARVIGVLFKVSPEGKTVLDRIEGLGAGYEEKVVTVSMPDGNLTMAHTYYATDIADGLLPYCWYRHHVLAGAREFGLPADYVQSIARVPHVSDDDAGRRTREMSIYRATE